MQHLRNALIGALLVILLPIVAFSQNDDPLKMKITIDFSDEDLITALHKIEEKAGFRFMYEAGEIKKSNKRVKAAFKNSTLAAILSDILSGTGMDYRELKGKIVIYRPETATKNAVASGLAVQRNGSLRGRVVDFETSQPLPGAAVQLEGTGHGVLSDDKGFYQFRKIPAGSYTLVVSYVGYQLGITKGVAITGGKQAVYDIKMQAGGSSLNAVVVGGNKHRIKAVTHTTERQLIEEIRNSQGVVSGISSEQIAKTPDRNAAEIVKRISGVTVVDDRFIVVRGMNERYNLTYLNGNVAPSTEIYSKAFAYDLLPSSIIDRILTYKSPVADLVADYAGAAVKIFTKNSIPVKHFDIGIQAAYRDRTTFQTINSYNGGKYDFLGFDDGTRKLPGFSPGIFVSNRYVTGLSQEQWLKGFTSTLAPGLRKGGPDLQLFANYYNNWRIGKARLYDLTSVTYTRETTFNRVYRQRGNTDAYAVSSIIGEYFGGNNKIIRSEQTTETGKLNMLENLTLKFNNRHSLALQNFVVNDGRRFTGIDYTTPNSLPEYYRVLTNNFRLDDILSFQQRFLYSGNLNGTHQLGSSKRQELVWNLGYTYDLQNVPDQRISHFGMLTPFSVDTAAWTALGTNTNSTTIKDGTLGMIGRLFIKNLEQVYNGSVDYTFHLLPALDIKAGGYQLFKTRQVGRRFFRVNRAGLSNGEVNAPVNAITIDWWNGFGVNNPELLNFRPQDLPNLWSAKWFPNDGTGLGVYDATTPVDSYVASEQYNAFYTMGDWKAARGKLTLNAGVRLEYDRQRLSGAKQGAEGHHSIEKVDVNHPSTLWLPSLNIGYRPDSLVVLRTSYGRTVNRPDFRELTPYGDLDFQNAENVLGNGHIVTAVIDNYDFRAEFYPRNNRGEMFNLGAFYKHIQHPIEKMRAEYTDNEFAQDLSGFTNITYDNAVRANLYGLEAEIKKSLSFISGLLFRRLSVSLNGSLIKSETLRRRAHNDQSSDSLNTKGGPLQGQSPYVVNAGLFYENPSSGTKIGLVYNVSGPRIYAKSLRTASDTAVSNTYIRPDLLQLPMHLLDFSITQRLVRSLQVKLSIQNLLDQSYRIVEDYHFNQKYDPERPFTDPNGKVFYKGDDFYTRYKPGRYVILQLTYAF